ncbi:methyltransferase domain-containing protein [Candidatus Saccharibacteria bacterium]|nr:MAG: methyltransferase domain-containing protein [Candidatus Saccharibacteria bacterium]
MRKQQQIWQEEHEKGLTLSRMANEHPASGVVKFINWLHANGVKPSGRAVDIGSGKGRNAVFLASLGYKVEALEYIELARKVTEQLAKSQGVAKDVTAKNIEIDMPWPYADDTFDIAIDSFSSIDIETKAGREMCRDEMLRTLKSGGYALVTVCSADDEWEKELIRDSPGSEPNSTLWPQNGKFQKDYTKDELRNFYSVFEVCELQTITKKTYKLNRDGTATNFWLVLRKTL